MGIDGKESEKKGRGQGVRNGARTKMHCKIGKGWFKRRKIVQSTIIRMLTSKYLTGILKETTENVIYPNLEKELKETGGIWTHPRKLLEYASFNTIYEATFGVSAVYGGDEYVEILALIDVN